MSCLHCVRCLSLRIPSHLHQQLTRFAMLFKSLAFSVLAIAASAQYSNSSSIESSSASGSSAATTATPTFTGSFDGANPHWLLTVPGAIGAWTSLDVELGLSAGASFTSVSIAVDDQPLAGNVSTVNVAAASLSLVLDVPVDSDKDLVVTINAAATSGNSWTASGSLTITLPDGSKKLIKREVLTYDLESTVTATSSVPPLSTSTDTENDQSTTVLTVTSCSENACSEVPVTTGVTVITTTEAGVVTEYTTYCPLTGETSTKAPETESTTVVTITSCSNGVCTEKESTSTKTEEVTSVTEQVTSTVGESSSSAVVSTFAGNAAFLTTSFLGLIVGLLLI